MSAVEDVKEILDSRRAFIFEIPGSDDAKSYYIGTPSGEDIRKADWEYSKIYAQAISDKLLTQAQMTDALQEAGIISDEYESQVERVRIQLGAELFRLENLMEAASDDEKESTAREIGRLRDELFVLNQRVNGPMANTCENLAEDARTDFLTCRIVENENGKNVWETYEDYRNDENTALTVRSRFEVMLWMQGLESNFLENTPEQQTLRSIAVSRAEEEIAAEEIAEAEKESGKVGSEAVEDSKDVTTRKKVAKKKSGSPRGRPKGSKSKTKKDTKAASKPPKSK